MKDYEELKRRLDKAVVECQNLQARRRKDVDTTQSTSLLRDINEDVARLGGKVEGLQLALGYLNDELRMLEEDGSSSGT